MKNALLLLTVLFTMSYCAKKQGGQLAPEIYILDNEKRIESFEELTNKLKGKPMFIDRWATWCSPCIEEFSYSDSLHNFLKANGIQMVYLNDNNDDIDEKKWFAFITEHNLRGYHLRLDNQLRIDLVKKGIYIQGVPRYMIVDRTGKVIENDAYRPSSGRYLYNQLKTKLNL